MARQFVKARLDGRTYTYHTDGNPLSIGDRVKLPDPRSDGWLRGEIVEIDVDEPQKFPTKAIVGLIADGE